MKKIMVSLAFLSVVSSGIIISCPITVKNDIVPEARVHIINWRKQSNDLEHGIFLIPNAEVTFGNDQEHALFDVVIDNDSRYKVTQNNCLQGERIVINLSDLIGRTLPKNLKDLFTIQR